MFEPLIRPEQVADIAPIRSVVRAAFAAVVHSNQKQSLLIDQLRECGALSVSLVAEVDSRIVGHIAFSPVIVDGMLCSWFGSAPLTVLPSFQRKGLGSRLVNAALQTLQIMGANGCVLLGEPDYYRRFGFAARQELILENVTARFFLVRSFSGGYLSSKVIIIELSIFARE
jgi:putative acetyltransferase